VKNNRKILYYLIITVLILCCIPKQSLYAQNNDSSVKLKLEPSDFNPRNSEGDFIRLKDGRILFIYSHFTNGAGDNSSAYLASRYSFDNGETWSKNDKTVLPQEGKLNVMSVSLLRLDNDNIALFYLRKNSESDCIPIMRISSDEAKTWSKPKDCITDVKGYYVMNNDRVVKLKSGRIVLPVALHNTPGNNISQVGRILCYYSDDNGNSWKRGKEINNTQKVVTQEPGIIELKNNKVMLFCRTDKGVQYFAYSNNECESWSELIPGNIKSPLSPAAIERIPSTGDLLLVWNNKYQPVRDGGKRTPLNIAISKDDGENWERIKTLENDPRGWYCYTAIEFVDNNVLLGYCAGNTRYTSGLATTNITKLSIDWLYRTATPEPFVQLNQDGIIELACKDTTASIYYSINTDLPEMSHNCLYKKPFRVNGITMLQMFAISDEHTKSKLVTKFIGEDIYQDALDAISISGDGLEYKYFKGGFRNTKDIQSCNIKNKGIVEKFSLSKWNDQNNFAVIFNGILQINKDNLFTFFIESNDGSVLFLDDKKVIDNDGLHGNYEKSVPISLKKGLHKISVKYFQAGGSKHLNLKWKTKNTNKEEIPAKVLFH
jgi:hypothetical protein